MSQNISSGSSDRRSDQNSYRSNESEDSDYSRGRSVGSPRIGSDSRVPSASRRQTSSKVSEQSVKERRKRQAKERAKKEQQARQAEEDSRNRQKLAAVPERNNQMLQQQQYMAAQQGMQPVMQPQFMVQHNSAGSSGNTPYVAGPQQPQRRNVFSGAFKNIRDTFVPPAPHSSTETVPVALPLSNLRTSVALYSQSALNSIMSEDRQKRVGSSVALLFSPVNLRPGLRFDENKPHGSGTSVSTVSSNGSNFAIPGPPSGPYPEETNKSKKKSRNANEDTGPRAAIFSVSYAKTLNTKPYVMVGVFALCLYMLIVEIVVNGGFEPLNVNVALGPSAYTMLRLGAKLGDLIKAGDWWRLVTPVFLHAGILHLLFNMMALRNIGVPAEREFGHLKIFVIFLFSGIFGILVSTLLAPGVVGVGASGGIFGLFGACWADLVQNWRLYRQDARSALTQLTFMTVLNFIFGLIPFIDNFAHMGGMLSGFLMGLFLLVHTRYTRKGEMKELYSYQKKLQLFAVVAYPFIFVTFTVLAIVGVDLSVVCPGCRYITCVPLPIWDCAF